MMGRQVLPGMVGAYSRRDFLKMLLLVILEGRIKTEKLEGNMLETCEVILMLQMSELTKTRGLT